MAAEQAKKRARKASPKASAQADAEPAAADTKSSLQAQEDERRRKLPLLSDWWRQLKVRHMIILGLLLLTALVFALNGFDEAVAVAVALFAATLLLLGAPPATEFARPFTQLAQALSPLLLPVFGVVIAVVLTGSWVVVLITVAVLFPISYYLIISPEWGRMIKALKDTWAWRRVNPKDKPEEQRWHRWKVMFLAFGAVVLVAGTVVAIVLLSLDLYEDRPDNSNVLLTAGVVFFFLAVLLRLGGYSRSGLRAFVGVVGILAIVRLLMAAGLLPLHDGLAGWEDDGGIKAAFAHLNTVALVQLFAVLLVLTAAGDAWGTINRRAYEAVGSLPTRGALKLELAETVTGLGFAAALAASLFVSSAAVAGVIDYQTHARTAVTEEEGRSAPDAEPGKAAPTTRGELASYYLPVLAFTEEERWYPVNVDSFLKEDDDTDVTLIGPDGEIKVPESHNGLPTREDCPRFEDSCFELTINCEEGDDDCAEGETRPGAEEGQPPVIEEEKFGTVYHRLLSNKPNPGRANPFPTAGPYADRTTNMVQYWFFYRFNEWTRPVVSGRLVQRHEGDWEAVTIGFKGTTPLWIAYSAHCGGTWRQWGQGVEIGKVQADGEHPLIAVAEGSHANYSGHDDRRATDWAKCKDFPRETTNLLNYAANLRDETAFDWGLLPREMVRATGETLPMTFPGTWGARDVTILSNLRDQELNSGSAPKSPPLQELWEDPMERIFCSKTWDGPEPCHG